MKKITLVASFFFVCSGSILANAYLDSLYSVYHSSKVDSERYNIILEILNNPFENSLKNYSPDSAIILLESSLKKVRAKNNPELLSFYLYRYVRYYNSEKDYELCNNYLDSCIQLAEPYHDYFYLGNLYSYKATNYAELKLQQHCVESVYKTIACYEKLENKVYLARMLFYLAFLYRSNQQYNKAEKCYLKSAGIFESVQDSSESAMCYVFCARIALKEKELNKAKAYLEKAKPLINGPFAYQHYYYYLGYGQWLKATGEKEEAIEYFKKAAVQCVKGNQRFQQPAALCEIAEIYLEQKKFNAAKKILDEATIVAREEQIGTQASALHNTLSKYYEAVNMPAKALEEFKKAQALKDSSNQNQLAQSLTGSALEFDYNKKEMAQAEQQRKRDEAEAQKLRTQKIIAYSIGTVLLFVGFISFLLYRNNREQKKANKIIAAEKQRSEDLLLNILPGEVAEELKAKGTADAKLFNDVTVFFSDFKSFTTISEKLTPQQLVDELHECFSAFDKIMEKYNIEKIKTVGDAYLAVSGLPAANPNHAMDMVNAAIQIQQFMRDRKKQNSNRDGLYNIRVGINSGSVVAGIVGIKKFAYDIWGDTVNTAARMEQNSEAGKINISETTYELVKDLPAVQSGKITCTYRGEIEAKNKGAMKMYFVETT